MGKKVQEEICGKMQSTLTSLGYEIVVEATEPRVDGNCMSIDIEVSVKKSGKNAGEKI